MELGVLTAFLLLLHLHTYTSVYMKRPGHDCGYPDHFLIVFTNNLMMVDYMLPETEFQLTFNWRIHMFYILGVSENTNECQMPP